MFESVITPAGGHWTRLAPHLTLVAIAAAFCLAFAGLVAAVQASQVIASLQRDVPTAQRPAVLVQHTGAAAK